MDEPLWGLTKTTCMVQPSSSSNNLTLQYSITADFTKLYVFPSQQNGCIIFTPAVANVTYAILADLKRY
jgi:hypothetical protein